MAKVILTKEGLEKLKAELNTLTTVKRAEVVDKIAKARAEGDLSENGMYQAAKDEQSFVEGRIAELEQILKNAVVETATKNNDTVQVGSVVTVLIKEKEDNFHIVGPVEANPVEKKISHESPLGKALIGKKVGEMIQVETPLGLISYIIKKIK